MIKPAVSKTENEKRSDISGFHKLEPAERLERVKEFAHLSDTETATLLNGLSITSADHMIENVVGIACLPLGIATNFKINSKDYLIPMAIEESSVVAAASHAAKLCRTTGGFTTSADRPIMIGQIQLMGVTDFEGAKKRLEECRDDIFTAANSQDSTLIKLGGGLKDFEVRRIDTEIGPMLIIHLLVDVRDAMGANAVNTMAERVSPLIERAVGGKAGLKIISNLATARLARASATWSKEALTESLSGRVDGDETVNGILAGWYFAKADPYRCATHNKGVMNGVDAVMIACGNDWRAVEAGAHTYSRLLGKPLTWYERTADGGIRGHIELPLAAGIIGGATKINPGARACLKILGVKSAQELSQIAAAVGLANNFAALRALATEGIQHGHMKLHATNIAVEAGAHGAEIEQTSQQMVAENDVSVARAKEIILDLRGLK